MLDARYARILRSARTGTLTSPQQRQDGKRKAEGDAEEEQPAQKVKIDLKLGPKTFATVMDVYTFFSHLITSQTLGQKINEARLQAKEQHRAGSEALLWHLRRFGPAHRASSLR